MKHRIISFLAAAVLLSACATTTNYKAVLDSWLFNSANDLVDSWGYPASTFEAPNGNTVYKYSSAGSYTMPINTNTTVNVVGNTAYANSTTTGGQTINLSCETFFEINSQKIIVDWSFKGNNCKTTTKIDSPALLSERFTKRLLDAQSLAAPEDETVEPDFAAAEAQLKEIAALDGLSEYEEAQLYNFYGFIYYSQEKYQQSIDAYEKVIALQETPPDLRNQVIYTLAQLKFTTEQYQEAIDLLNNWLKTQENPGPEPFILIATGYYQLEEIDKIIPPVEKAMAIAQERGTQTKEQWWLLLRVAYWEKGNKQKVKEILEILETNWPKKEYRSQLAVISAKIQEAEVN